MPRGIAFLVPSPDLTHGVALAIVRHVAEGAPGPVSVVVVDEIGSASGGERVL